MIEALLLLSGAYGAYKLLRSTPVPYSLKTASSKKRCRKLNKAEWSPEDRAYFQNGKKSACKKTAVDREYGGNRKECENDFAAGIALRKGYGADRSCT